jgi:hypothetical protein
MKTKLNKLAVPACPAIVASILLAVARIANVALAADVATATTTAEASDNEANATTSEDVRIEAAPTSEGAPREVPWLGISTMEASEALSSQLELEPGVGLVITYVVPDSPAAKAGLQKNDVLTRFDEQSLVHPAQFRKLVRVRKEGDTVNLVYYRSGKRQKVSVTLGKTKAETRLWNEENEWKNGFRDLQKQFRDMHLDDAVRDQVKVLRDSLGNIKIDQKEVREDIQRGMEEAQKAIREALRTVTNAEPVRKVLENFAHSGVVMDDRADVVVRSSSRNVKSMVRSDDSGTIVLVSNPKLHLTVHDKDGKLLFDGPIESSDDRSKVPPEVWDHVEPLVNQMHTDVEQPEPKESE